MSICIETERLQLKLESAAEAKARIDSIPEEYKAELSADWLEMFAAAKDGDFWILGFAIVRRGDGATIGSIGFKGKPHDGAVEIAYAIDDSERCQGFATEAAKAATEFALHQADVVRVLAHTLPETNASTRVLTKCGYQQIGSVVDPDDGPVWRWEFKVDNDK